ncbi:MAG: glycosyltransferase family 4 protein [Methanosarcinales archaeon]|nr:glycosyltransferase family 4 protein [Methanosarcinales archaeon]
MNNNKLRIFLGPFHTAGIQWEYRQGLRSIGVDAKVVVFVEHPFQYPSDIEFKFTGSKYIKLFKKNITSCIQLPKLILNFDVFHMYSSILPFKIDVYILKLFRKKIIIHFTGGDIRSRNIHGIPLNNNIINKKKKNIKFWENYADAIISFPEYSQLLTKKYHTIPLGFNLEYWKPFISNKFKKNDNKILIIHSPSNREIKGTKYVIEAIELLINEGFEIEFKLLENLSNSEIREWINVSDIVLDQFMLGWHGAFAIESMALMKPTLCYINEEWKNCVEYAKNIPLVNTSHDKIYDNLKLLIENPNLRKELGEKGRKYVEEVHDSKKVAKQLLELYKSL